MLMVHGRATVCAYGKEAPVEPMSDFAQLHLHFTDHVQWRYEVIRPLVLFEDRTVEPTGQRKPSLHPETVRQFTRRFQQQGMLGLFPDTVDVVRPEPGQAGPGQPSSRRLPA